MDHKNVVLLKIFLCFVIMAVDYSAGNPYSYTDPLYLYDQTGGLTSVQRPSDDFIVNGRNMLQLEESDREKRDVEALLSFRNGITSDPYGSLSNWMADNSDNVCRWTGISCRHLTKRVVAIRLHGSSLQGTISPSVGNLSLLHNLDLSANSLTGRIPPEFGKLKALRRLDLRATMLQGPIPKSLCNCTRLQAIDFSLNRLRGSIPAEIGRLVKLESLFLSDSGLSGSIPPSLGNCSSLQELYIDNNSLSGPIPAEFGRLVKLKDFRLYENNLSGNIPTSMSNCTSLQTFWGFLNSPSGQIPRLYKFKATELLVFSRKQAHRSHPSIHCKFESIDSF